MSYANNEEFARLSAECRRHLKAGMLDWFAFDLKSMGALLGKEGKYTDKLKVLMLAFYIELSGVCCRSTIDRAILPSIRNAAEKSGLTKHQIEQLYLDTVRADVTPRHIMTVKDSLYLLSLCLDNKEEDAEDILSNLTHASLTK
ncbi:MAG: hypothetical protein E7449_01015 [Ruminococcaceae bacterium]|nr:hypothetical protein [Oscillospiraceae bacterium]